MEQTALRPKPMPGQKPEGGGGDGSGGPARRPHAARRRGRRLTTLLFGIFVGTVLVLSGVGLGTVGATVIGMSKLAELQRPAGRAAQTAPGGGPSAPAHPAHPGRSGASALSDPSAPSGPSPAPLGATLGLEAVDAEKAGAQVVAVHIPGPGHTAGLVRGDVLLRFGTTRIGSASDLARAVDGVRPGKKIDLTVRHENGGYQQLVVVPGVVT